MTHKQIEATVVVIIHPGCAGTPIGRRTAYATRLRRIAKLSISLIVKKAAFADAGDEDIRKPVIIVIAHSQSHSVEADVEPRAGSRVRKMAPAIIVVEDHRGFSLCFVPGPI